MTAKELLNLWGESICEYCHDNILHTPREGVGDCDGDMCWRASEGFAASRGIEIESY